MTKLLDAHLMNIQKITLTKILLIKIISTQYIEYLE